MKSLRKKERMYNCSRRRGNARGRFLTDEEVRILLADLRDVDDIGPAVVLYGMAS